MTNRELYKFDDFTLSNYRKLIQIAKAQGFQFILHKDKYVSERKDIYGVTMLNLVSKQLMKWQRQKQKRVLTTYFFQLHCPCYNLFSIRISSLLQKIKDLGHHIGLHFDSHYYNVQSEDELNQFIELDRNYMNAVLGLNIDTYSFHNTNPFILSCKEYKYGGLLFFLLQRAL